MASSTVPTLELDGRNWKVFWPAEASSDDKMQESCTKPEELSVEPPSEERLKDVLTEASSEEEAEAAVGAAQQTLSQSIKVKENLPELHKQLSSRARKPPKNTDTLNANSGTTNGQSCYPEKPQLTIYSPGGTLQWLMASSQEVENGKSVPSMPTGHAGKVNGCTRQHIPKAQRVLLKGELAGCVSDSTGHVSSNKKNLQGHTKASRAPGMCAEGTSGQEEPIDLPVNMPKTPQRHSYEATNRRQKDKNTYQGQGNAISHAQEGIGTSLKLTIKFRMLDKCPESIRSQCSVSMNAPSQVRGPRGQEVANKVLRDVKDEWRHQNDGAQVGTDGMRYQMDGATSSTCCNSKRVKMKLLAEGMASQQQQQQHKPGNVPGPSTKLQKCTYEPTRPRQRCSQIKLESRKVRRTWKGENMYQGCDNAIVCPQEGIRTLQSLTVKSRAHWKCQ
ncbi:hypothetical protein EV401DRAFT_1888615 [Pisolithus croceorrhizus]|nr:hypothetical protein EV401DRAFT_1888615 [Pisolithus croceorrhizus]